MSAGVKHFSSTLHHALREERHFALVDGVTFPIVGSLVIVFQVRNSVRPMHLFGHTRDHDYYFELPHKRGAGYPINFSVFYCTPCVRAVPRANSLSTVCCDSHERNIVGRITTLN
jgi:hypothetical protein